MPGDVLYTPEEVANQLKVKKSTVYEMIKRGDLEAHHIGKSIRISEAQLNFFMLKSKDSGNIYDACITSNNGKSVARVGTVDIRVNTDAIGNVKIAIHPEDIILSKGKFASSARNILEGSVIKIIDTGVSIDLILDIGIPIKASITKESFQEMGIEIGSKLFAVFKATAVKVFK